MSSRVATCVDYDSDEGELVETAKQANIAKQRANVVSENAPIIPDRSSDSEYSTPTVLTNASADSAKSLKPEALDHGSSVTYDSMAHQDSVASHASCVKYKIVQKDGKKFKKCIDEDCPQRLKKAVKSSKSNPNSVPSPPSSAPADLQPHSHSPLSATTGYPVESASSAGAMKTKLKVSPPPQPAPASTPAALSTEASVISPREKSISSRRPSYSHIIDDVASSVPRTSHRDPSRSRRVLRDPSRPRPDASQPPIQRSAPSERSQSRPHSKPPSGPPIPEYQHSVFNLVPPVPVHGPHPNVLPYTQTQYQSQPLAPTHPQVQPNRYYQQPQLQPQYQSQPQHFAHPDHSQSNPSPIQIHGPQPSAAFENNMNPRYGIHPQENRGRTNVLHATFATVPSLNTQSMPLKQRPVSVAGQETPSSALFSARTPIDLNWVEQDSQGETCADEEENEESYNAHLYSGQVQALPVRDPESSTPHWEPTPQYLATQSQAQVRARKHRADTEIMPPPSPPPSKTSRPSLSMRHTTHTGASTHPTASPVYGKVFAPPIDDLSLDISRIAIGRPALNPLGSNARIPHSLPAAPRSSKSRPQTIYNGESDFGLSARHERNDLKATKNVEMPLPKFHESVRLPNPRGVERYPAAADDDDDIYLHEANAHMNRARSQASSHQSQNLQSSAVEESSSSRRSKYSSQESSPHPARGRRQSLASSSQVGGHEITIKLNTAQACEFDIGDKHYDFRPDKDGNVDLHLSSKRDLSHGAHSGSGVGSRVGRRSSVRASRYDDDAIAEDDGREQRETRPRYAEHAGASTSTHRRRAETQSAHTASSARRAPSHGSEPSVPTAGDHPQYATNMKPIVANNRHSYAGQYEPSARYAYGHFD